MRAMAEPEPSGAVSSGAISQWLIAGAKPPIVGAGVSRAERSPAVAT
jgi:hypothetical protein